MSLPVLIPVLCGIQRVFAPENSHSAEKAENRTSPDSDWAGHLFWFWQAWVRASVA